MKDIGIKYFKEIVIIYCDNTSTFDMSRNLVLHSKTKHISIKYHVLKDKVVEKEIKLEYLNTKEQIANIFNRLFLRINLSICEVFLGLCTYLLLRK